MTTSIAGGSSNLHYRLSFRQAKGCRQSSWISSLTFNGCLRNEISWYNCYESWFYHLSLYSMYVGFTLLLICPFVCTCYFPCFVIPYFLRGLLVFSTCLYVVEVTATLSWQYNRTSLWSGYLFIYEVIPYYCLVVIETSL